jgi:hypothetical protein
MALALASIDFCIKATFLARASREALRSSPMVTAQEATDDDEDDGLGMAGAGDGLGFAAASGGLEGATADEGKDRLDRDTRLSRASAPKVAGPRLRIS